MKVRWLSIPATALLIIGAGQALTTESLVTEAPIPAAQNTPGLTPEALARKSGCLECHSIDKKVIGPALHEVAVRYKDDARARAMLIEKVTKGGKGHWTEVTRGVPMPPHEKVLSAAEIARLVDWVLSLKDTETK